MEILDQHIPLRTDEQGIVRVGDTRVRFELVIRAYLQGHTPEEIVRQYTTLPLSDVYAAIAYFLQHRDQVDEYLARREEEAERVRETLTNAGIALDVRTFLGREESK